MKCFIALLFLGICLNGFSQQADTSIVINPVPEHSPTKATLMSLALPGLGQAYNKKYWKIPIVYGMIGTSLYFAIDQQKQFKDFKSAYLKRVDDDSTTVDTKYLGIFRDDQLLAQIDNRRRDRDLLFVLTGVAYMLNIVDAAVDAHLYYFDVSDDLVGTVKPSFQRTHRRNELIPSLTLSLKFAKNNHRQRF